MNWTTIAALVLEIAGVILPVLLWIKKISDGQKSLLRSEMLQIYYRNREKGEIHQYEYETFVYLYEAYKALKGNSFVDKIYQDVKSWEVIS